MKKEYEYKIEKQNDGKFLVTFNDPDESVTEGASFAEASYNAQELKFLLEDDMYDYRIRHHIHKKRRKTDPEFVVSLSRLKRVKHRNQRKDRGWSDIDAWNADCYFAKVISEMVTHHKTLPYLPYEISQEEWHQIIDDIAIPLKNYYEVKDKDELFSPEEITAIYENANKAMHLFSEHFINFNW